MKAIVIHNYGGPEVLRYEDYPDPVAKSGEVLVKVAATSINPIDIKRRSGAMKEIFPIRFPGIVGVDVAGTVQKLGPGVNGWSVGDKVFAFADQTYGQLCAVKAVNLAKVPDGLDLVESAALPLVLTTGAQLISEGTGIKEGQTVLVIGAIGSVGRAAVFAAKERGAKVVAAVRAKHMVEAKSVGADWVISTEDNDAIAKLPAVDAVADTVAGETAQKFMGKVKSGGIFASVLPPPGNAKEYPSVKIVSVGAHPDSELILRLGQAVKEGKLKIPISRKVPLKDAAAAHAAIEGGLAGKILLLPQM